MSQMNKSCGILASSWTRCLLFALVLMGLATAFAIADVVPVTGELAVNTTTDGDQRLDSDIAHSDRIGADAAGNFAVVWQGSSSADPADIDVYVRLFHADGSARSGEIRVNTTTAGARPDPRIAMADNGKFLVVWRQTSDNQIKGRWFNASGSPLTGEVGVSGKAGGNHYHILKSVAMDADGDSVVLWVKGSVTGLPNGSSILFQRYNAAGKAQGKPTVAATSDIGNPTAVLDMDANGNFVFVTADFFQRYSASGAKIGPQFIYKDPGARWSISDIALAADGSFVLALSGDTGSFGLYAKTYNADGSAAASTFEVSPIGGGSSMGVAIDDTSHELVFIRAGTITIPPPGEPQKSAVLARRYDFAGNPLTDQFEVNTTPLLVGPWNSSVAATVNGGFVAAWDLKTDGDNRDVFARVYGFVAP
jgi:hypothetical protein